MAATLTNQVSSLLQANSDEVHGIALCNWAIGNRLWAIEVVAKARDIGHPIPNIRYLNKRKS